MSVKPIVWILILSVACGAVAIKRSSIKDPSEREYFDVSLLTGTSAIIGVAGFYRGFKPHFSPSATGIGARATTRLERTAEEEIWETAVAERQAEQGVWKPTTKGRQMLTSSDLLTGPELTVDDAIDRLVSERIIGDPNAISNATWSEWERRYPKIKDIKNNKEELIRFVRQHPDFASSVSKNLYESNPVEFENAITKALPRSTAETILKLKSREEAGQVIKASSRKFEESLGKELQQAGFTKDEIEKKLPEAREKLLDAMIKSKVENFAKTMEGRTKIKLKDGSIIFSGETGIFSYEQPIPIKKILLGALAAAGGSYGAKHVVEYVTAEDSETANLLAGTLGYTMSINEGDKSILLRRKNSLPQEKTTINK